MHLVLYCVDGAAAKSGSFCSEDAFFLAPRVRAYPQSRDIYYLLQLGIKLPQLASSVAAVQLVLQVVTNGVLDFIAKHFLFSPPYILVRKKYLKI